MQIQCVHILLIFSKSVILVHYHRLVYLGIVRTKCVLILRKLVQTNVRDRVCATIILTTESLRLKPVSRVILLVMPAVIAVLILLGVTVRSPFRP